MAILVQLALNNQLFGLSQLSRLVTHHPQTATSKAANNQRSPAMPGTAKSTIRNTIKGNLDIRFSR